MRRRLLDDRAASATTLFATLVVAAQAWAQPPGRPGRPAAAPAPDAEPSPPPPAPEAEEPVDERPLRFPPAQPLGFTGASPFDTARAERNVLRRDALPVPDRWRLGWPRWDRYGRVAGSDPVMMNSRGGDVPYTVGHPLNPYDRNVLKGDYPIRGDDIFLNATLISDTLAEYRRLPVPSGVSAAGPGAFDFFGDGEQNVLIQNVFASVDVFQGNTAFRPVDWLVRVTGAYNFNRVELRENNATDIDVRKGDTRTNDRASLQEAFFEYHLGDVSHRYDIAAVRVGRQLFVSDFRGLIFNDVTDGVRLFGNLASNRVQYNLAWFNQNEKDTNSGLSELHWRDQQLLIANLYVQDFIVPGYTTQLSFHWNHDQSDMAFDDNGFLVIPDLAGSSTLRDVDAYYLGWAGDGHIGRLNINHAAYYAFGEDTANPIAGRPVDIDAYLGAIELSLDVDWLRPKISFLHTSGDRDPFDDRARGFDGIFENPVFAGGPGSFFQRQAFRLFGVDLVSERSLFFDMAANKLEGQSNFVNPGTSLLNLGLEASLTPKLRASFNYNRIWFAQTQSLELFLNQDGIDTHFGDELNLVMQYRPTLNNNIILTGGASVFIPGRGYEDIFESGDELYQVFAGITLTY